MARTTAAPDWGKVHPKGIGTVGDLARIEAAITGEPADRRMIHERLNRNAAAEARWAPALVGETAAGKIYDIATYVRLREEHASRDHDSKEG